MDADTLRAKLGDFRQQLVSDAIEFPDLTCLMIHEETGDPIVWNTATGPVLARGCESVRFSTTAIREHHFFRSAPSPPAPSPRSREGKVYFRADKVLLRIIDQEKRDKQFALGALERFRARVGEMGKWLRWIHHPRLAGVPRTAGRYFVWLWSVFEARSSLPDDDPRHTDKRYLVPFRLGEFEGSELLDAQCENSSRSLEIDYPATPLLLQKARQRIAASLGTNAEALAVLTRPPKSYYCTILDLFSASVDLIDLIRSSLPESPDHLIPVAKSDLIKWLHCSLPTLKKRIDAGEVRAKPGSSNRILLMTVAERDRIRDGKRI